MVFNAWMVEVIKEHVDLKMSNLKPQICEWLHHAWFKMKDKKFMIVKG